MTHYHALHSSFTDTSISVCFSMLYPSILIMLNTLRTLQTIPRSMVNPPQDNIEFEDVLGVLHNLPWQHFRHWAVSHCIVLFLIYDLHNLTSLRCSKKHWEAILPVAQATKRFSSGSIES